MISALHASSAKFGQAPTWLRSAVVSARPWPAPIVKNSAGQSIFTTPGVPAERVAALRKAFDTMVHDPAFIEETKREKFDIDPTTGDSMQQIVNEMMAMPEAQRERLKQIIE